jgi:hypothetical protein
MRYRTIRVFFFIIAFLLILAAINIRIISSSLVTPAKVESSLYNIFGTKFSVGQITFNFWRGIKISDIKLPLTDSNGATTYDFIKAKTLRVTYDQTKLLRGQFVIDKIVLYNAEMHLNNNRIPDFKLSAPGNTPSPTIILKNASMVFSDSHFMKDNTALILKNINMNLYPIVQGRYVVEGGFDAAEFGNWKVRGELDSNLANTNLNLLSQNTDIGAYLSEKLSSHYNIIWQHYQPQGKVNLNILLKTDNGLPPDVTILMDCQKNNMTYSGFPFPLSKVEGQVEFTLKGVSIKNLRGINGLTTVAANGYVDGYEQSGGLDLLLKIQNMSFDDKLHNVMNQQFRNIWDELSLGGLADAEVLISKSVGAKQEIFYHTKLYCKKLQVKPSFFPYSLDNLTGEIEIADRLIKLKNLSAQRNKGEFKIDGEITISPNGKVEAMAINIDAKNIETNDYILKGATNKILTGIDALWDKSQPAGPVNVTLTLQKSAGQPDINARTVVQCNGVTAKVGPSTLAFSNIHGQIEYYSNYNDSQQPYLVLKNLAADYDKSKFELSGGISNPGITTTSSKAPSKISLDLKISNLLVGGNALYGLFPSNLKYLLDQINFSTNSDISLKITNENQGIINYRGEIKLFDCGFTKGLSFSNITGSIIFKGFHSVVTTTPSSHLAGSGKFSQLKVEDKVINNMSLTFLQENNHISFYDIKGNAYNGAINGFFILTLPLVSNSTTPTDTYEYQGKIEIGSIDMKDFSRDTRLGNKDISGKLSGQIDFGGKGTSLNDLNVKYGRAILTDAQIWEVPVFFSVYTLFGLTKKTAFHEGEIRFTISNGEMQIKKLVFTSKDVILKSAGKMKLKDGSLDLQFDTKFLDIKIIKIIDDIKNLFVSGIYTVKIGGTFSDPKAEVKLLPILFE